MGSHFSLGLTFVIIIFLSVICDATNSCGADNILRIELDIFSGRENPFWNLTLNESEVFIEKFASLPEGNENASVEGGLGYRGIIITGDLLNDKCLEKIKIFRGVANVTAGDRVSNLTDPGRELELWLIETGETHIDRDLYESVRQEISNANQELYDNSST